MSSNLEMDLLQLYIRRTLLEHCFEVIPQLCSPKMLQNELIDMV